MDKKGYEDVNKYKSAIYRILEEIESEKILVAIYTYIKHITNARK